MGFIRNWIKGIVKEVVTTPPLSDWEQHKQDEAFQNKVKEVVDTVVGRCRSCGNGFFRRKDEKRILTYFGMMHPVAVEQDGCGLCRGCAEDAKIEKQAGKAAVEKARRERAQRRAQAAIRRYF